MVNAQALLNQIGHLKTEIAHIRQQVETLTGFGPADTLGSASWELRQIERELAREAARIRR